jgi:HEAT repeat protein
MSYRDGRRFVLAVMVIVVGGVTLIGLGGATTLAADKPVVDRHAVDGAAVNKAFEALKTYDWGKDYKVLKPIDDAVVATQGDAAARKDLETRLAVVLKTNVSRDAKDYVCRKLMVIGSAESVPTLAGLLPSKDLSHMARYALERIPAPEAAEALRDALPHLTGTLKVGVIGSLGVRHDAASVPALVALLGDADAAVARAAACALGDIGSLEAATALGQLANNAPEGVKPAIVDAYLECAERLLADGKKADALLIYKSLNSESRPKQVRLAAVVGLSRLAAADQSNEELIQMIVGLVNHKDRDMRAVGFQQVRESAKGTAATSRFVALLPALSPGVQAGLLAALATRGDVAARPAVLEMLRSREPEVRTAAIEALGALGDTADVPALAQWAAGTAAEEAAARASLIQLSGPTVNAAIVAELKQSSVPAIRVNLLRVLAARDAKDSVTGILPAAEDADAKVRMAAMTTLAQLAGPERVADMVKGLLKAEPGPEREAAERAVMVVCDRNKDAAKRAEPLLAALTRLSEDDQTTLLPTLGRVGGPAARKVVDAAIADQNPNRREAGLRALCNWPDASAAPKLQELAESGDAGQRIAVLRALIRVAALPDKRSDAERLNLLKKTMTMVTRDEERNLVIRRARAVRTIESLRFAVPYLDQPALAQAACGTVVELAHHRELREPNKAEFGKALDVVIRIGKDPGMVDRAKRYKKGQT